MPNPKSKTPKLTAEEQATVNEMDRLSRLYLLSGNLNNRLKCLQSIDRIVAAAAKRQNMRRPK